MFIGYIVPVLLLVLLVAGLRIANQYERAVIFRLGKYARTSGPGLYLLIPLIEWQVTIDMRTMTTAVEQQEAITKDNVPVKINAVIWRKTIDPERIRRNGAGARTTRGRRRRTRCQDLTLRRGHVRTTSLARVSAGHHSLGA